MSPDLRALQGEDRNLIQTYWNFVQLYSQRRGRGCKNRRKFEVDGASILTNRFAEWQIVRF